MLIVCIVIPPGAGQVYPALPFEGYPKTDRPAPIPAVPKDNRPLPFEGLYKASCASGPARLRCNWYLTPRS